MLESTLAQNIEQDAAQAASLCGWIVKGLAMRGYGHLEYWIDKVVLYAFIISGYCRNMIFDSLFLF